MKLRRHMVVIAAAVSDTTRHLCQLRANDRGGEVRQAKVVERQLVLPAGKRLGQNGVLLPIVLISAGHDDGLSHEIGVIADQDAPLPGIQELVGLERKATDMADRADLPAVPRGPERMRGVFDHRDARLAAKRHDRIHVGRMAPHVADDHGPTLRKFAREIVDVDAVVLSAFGQNRHAIRMDDGGRHGGKGERRDQDFRAPWQAQRLQ